MERDAWVRDAYTRMAVVYEERVVPRFAPIAARTVALAAPAQGERVLDVGCGTGLAALLAAERVGPRGEVVGLDFSEGQLGVAEGKARLRGLAQVKFALADATRLGFRAEFDACISNLGIPPDYAAALAGMARALRPGGRASVCEWQAGHSEPFASFRALLAERADPDPPPEVRAVREGMAARRAAFERIGTPEGLGGAMRAAGLAGVEARVERYPVRFASPREAWDLVVSWGWQEEEVRRLPGPEREGLMRDLAARLGSGPFTATWAVVHGTGRKT